jgi:predicted ribosome quality control (RQC) complex YloA/Tae2 family protein
MKTFIIENITCKVGSNSFENWQLLENIKDTYLFFHLTSFPSCYVILQSDEYPDIKIIKECAYLCKQNTKYKNLKNIKVDYTMCNNITKGEKEGEIIYKSNKKVKNILI